MAKATTLQVEVVMVLMEVNAAETLMVVVLAYVTTAVVLLVVLVVMMMVMVSVAGIARVMSVCKAG